MANKDILLQIINNLASNSNRTPFCNNNFKSLQLLLKILNDDLDNYVVFENGGGGLFCIWYESPDNKLNLELADNAWKKYWIVSKIKGEETVYYNTIKSLNLLL